MTKFDAEFKVEAVKRALTSGLPVASVAVELDSMKINYNK